MREFKHRGQRLRDRQWVYGQLLQNEERSIIVVSFRPGSSDCDYSVNGYEVDPETVEQFAYQLDKHSKEIYEGNIVRCTEVNNSKVTEYTSIVEWVGDAFMIEDENKTWVPLSMFVQGENKVPLTEIKIIGDVHESSDREELLDENR